VTSLQWGGRFDAPPNTALLQFGSSLEDDLVLAPFDVRCSGAHVLSLREGGVISREAADALLSALERVSKEIESGAFGRFARDSNAEDVHGAIDARVRELAPESGELLHAGRSRNDQVATTLLLYCAARAERAKTLTLQIAAYLTQRAQTELGAGTMLAATTHWQPAQPVLLAFWLAAAAEPFVRDARRFARTAVDAMEKCPLGSGAVAGSSLPLDRGASATALAFAAPSRNAMDAIGNRDVACDLAYACVRTLNDASRISEELVLWCTPAFGYARLDDAASTGSSLMPQKRNPDPLELVRATSADLVGRFAGALGSMSGIALSYHRDLQVTKGAIISIVETALRALDAFALALSHVHFMRDRMSDQADRQFTVATDVADALIAQGATAREAHAAVGAQILAHEQDGALLEWPDARASIQGKRTAGSTNAEQVAISLEQLQSAIAELAQ